MKVEFEITERKEDQHILVDNGGTERIQAPEGATTPSAPFCCDSNYSISVKNLVAKLNSLNNS